MLDKNRVPPSWVNSGEWPNPIAWIWNVRLAQASPGHSESCFPSAFPTKTYCSIIISMLR